MLSVAASGNTVVWVDSLVRAFPDCPCPLAPSSDACVADAERYECLTTAHPALEGRLIYPTDAEAHFEEVHTQLKNWTTNVKMHYAAGFRGPWIENRWIGMRPEKGPSRDLFRLPALPALPPAAPCGKPGWIAHPVTCHQPGWHVRSSCRVAC